jgi:plastocyanin
VPADQRAKYGIVNRMPDGSAPNWMLVAMVMNHVKKPKTVYVRTKVHYTEEERQPVHPTVVGCRGNGMSYDVPGGGPKGSNFVDTSTWTVPYNGRILMGASHQHGGGKRQTLASDTCNRKLLDAPVYHGTSDHIYNTIRPILHEPGPIANGTFGTKQGIPVREGEVLRRRAVHDAESLHVASMGFWVLHMVRDDSVEQCGPMPTDLTELRRPKRFDKTPPHDRKVPQLEKPTGAFAAFTGGPITIADSYFRPGKLEAKRGDTLTWEFKGSKPHTVTVANGPRGFSSLYSGQVRGSKSFTFDVPGTYRLTCLVHPTTMSQTVRVR